MSLFVDPLRTRLPGWLLLGWLALAATPAPAFEVESVEPHWDRDVLLLDARMSFTLSEEARTALQSGVPLVLMLQIEVLEPRNYVWDRVVARLRQRYRLSYHALSERYVVQRLNTGVRASFSSLEGALYSLGQVQALPVLDRSLLEPGQDYYGQLRVALDVEALPTPLRVWAYVTSDWQLGSDWYPWPIQP
ncbi:DUF4390 domain-containing protein [Thiohalobacter thiocyanaticus]|uniref:DUF4390 domain-containing protein n=1 Tax=Thiohalobacter thiocyanaticus TaxID=585455 RepID=A0A426QJB0_9GAMM|nr:DUF4390 domain-containing protein [Thiohalobacter thiocyanaticus]RRQ21838.1 DUF4390 domain-containing protein [Thiohalobacter thiocyanaticus]